MYFTFLYVYLNTKKNMDTVRNTYFLKLFIIGMRRTVDFLVITTITAI